jgi:hypothetical protein
MSDLAPTADRRPGLAGKPASPKMMMLVLWIAVVAARAAPAIRAGVFDAMEADDAMRLVEAI